ncbi:MAG: hypothetical protein P4M12_05815, partial [Gammaproteobacteria bacterium]|nr:hypothetical protein [Gammaproteobacteria bacterium]
LSFVLSGVEMILEYKVYPTFGNKWFRKIVCYMPIIFIIISFVMMSGQRAYSNLQMNRVLSDGPFTPSSKSLFDYISDHTEKDSTVIFRKPRVMGLLTKHKSVAIHTLGQIVGQISRWDYICLSKTTDDSQISPSESQELLAQGLVQLVYENSEFLLYKFRPESKK